MDGDTYDVPAMIETAETRRRVHGLPQATFGHREKFGNDPAKHVDFSAVTHVKRDKGIPPFLILHVADRPDSKAQSELFAKVLNEAGVSATLVPAVGKTHGTINSELGMAGDKPTEALFEFVKRQAAGEPLKLRLRSQQETAPKSGKFEATVEEQLWQPHQTAIVVCDMWDAHTCPNAAQRVAQMAPRMNEVLKAARSRGPSRRGTCRRGRPRCARSCAGGTCGGPPRWPRA